MSLFGLILIVGSLILVILYITRTYRGLFEAITILFYKGPPYVVTDERRVKLMIKLADLKKGDKVVDLGSGDGRIVFEAAKKSGSVTGFEINPFVIRKSQNKLNEVFVKYKNRIRFTRTDFMQEDLSGFSVIFVYGIGYLMEDLERKLDKELKKGSRVICNYFKFPRWKPQREVDGIFLYKKM